MSGALVDTGVLLAFLDYADPWHERCHKLLAQTDIPVLTTAAVLTELFHLLKRRVRHIKTGLDLLETGGIVMVPTGPSDLPNILLLMRRYADRPMDFADATLVHVASREGIADILTIDHDDFEAYRFGRNRKFRIQPSR